MICPKCKKELKDGVKFCGYCGKKFNSVNTPEIEEIKKNAFNYYQNESHLLRKAVIDGIDSVSTQGRVGIQSQPQPVFSETQSNVAKCPRCGSTSLQAKTKGVSVGKAAAGALLIGPLGLLAGGIGMNDARIVCLNCGYEFEPRGE